MRLRLSLAALLAAAMFLCGEQAAAQEVRPVEQVSLRRDQTLDIHLDIIRAAAHDKDWDRASRALKEIERFIDTNGNEYVLPAPGAEDDSLFTGAREAAYRALALLPEDALASWRMTADSAVQAALDACRDNPKPSLLQKTISKYPLSSSSVAALDLLGSIYFEKGDFARVLRLCARARAYFPNIRKKDKARFDLLRILSYTALMGDRPRDLTSKFKSDYRDVSLQLRGRPAPATDVIDDLLSSISGPASIPPSLPGGTGDMNWSVQFAPAAGEREFFEKAKNSRVGAGLHIDPVAAGGRVFCCDSQRMHAFDAATGTAIWSFTSPSSPVSSDFHNSFCRPAIDGEFAAASLGSELYVLDSGTGTLRWKASPGRDEGVTYLHLTSPCMFDGTIIVGACSWGKEATCALFAYDAENGSLLWRKRIVTGNPADTLGLGSQPGPPVCWGGAVYFVTNLGSTVCCDAKSGKILWLRTYGARDALLKEESIFSGRRWALLPLVLHRGVLIAAPQDSPYLLAADALDGRLLWQKRRAELENLRFLGGSSGNLVFATGSSLNAFDCQTGMTAWSVPLPEEATGPAAVFADRVVVPCGRMLAEFTVQEGKPLGRYLLPRQAGLAQQIAEFEDGFVLAAPWLLQRFQNVEESTRAITRGLTTQPKNSGLLLSHGRLMWRRGRFEEGVKSLENCIKQIADTDLSREKVVRELLLASLTAAESTTGKARAGYCETAAIHAEPSEKAGLLLRAARAYEDAGLTKEALRAYRLVLVNHQARNVQISGHAVYADDYARVCESEILKNNPDLAREQEKVAEKLLASGSPQEDPAYLLDVIRAFPNSDAAAKACSRLGLYCIKENLLESSQHHLSRFLARRADSPHAMQIRALLCETYLRKADYMHAKILLREMVKSEAPVKLPDTECKASEYAASRLKLPNVAAVSPEDGLPLPLAKIWQTTPSLVQPPPDITGTDAKGSIIYSPGPDYLDCRSSRTGVLLARFNLEGPSLHGGQDLQPGTTVEDGVVILRWRRLLKIGSKGEKPAIEWGVTLPSPDAVPGIAPREVPLIGKHGQQVLVLWPHSRLLAYNAGSGAKSWVYKSSKRYYDLPAEIGGNLFLVQEDGEAAVGLDPARGASKFTIPLQGRDLRTSGVLACGEKLLVIRGSRDLYCLSKEGRILWSKQGDSFFSSAVQIGRDRVALMPGPGASREVVCLKLSDGKLLWKSDIGKDPVTHELGDAKGLYVVQRPEFGATSIMAIDTGTGKRRWVWRQPRSGYAKEVKQTPTHILVWLVDLGFTQLQVVDKVRGVQEQIITFPGEEHQSSLVYNRRLYITTDRSAYCLGNVDRATAREEFIRLLYLLNRKSGQDANLDKLADLLTRMQSFEKAAQLLEGKILSQWNLSDKQIAALIQRASGCRFAHDSDTPVTIEVPRMSRPVSIDGVLDGSWLPALAIERSLDGVFGVDRPDGAAGTWLSKLDLSATYYFGWDEKNFYFAVDTRDSIIRPWDRDDKESWKGDLILMAIDPLGDGGWVPRGDDVLLSLGLTLPRQNMTPEEKDEEERNKPKGEYFVKRKDDNSGVIYEVSIPWKLFNNNGTSIDLEKGPPENFSFGLDLVVLDDDTGGGTAKTLNLSGGLILGRRNAVFRGFIPHKFAIMRLKGKQDDRGNGGR